MDPLDKFGMSVAATTVFRLKPEQMLCVEMTTGSVTTQNKPRNQRSLVEDKN
jgi:hypothetical protein